MTLLKKKLPASTLPEVLISMVIILAVFTIAITIYTRITFSGFSLTDHKVQSEMHRIISETELNNNWEEELSSLDSINYSKKVVPYLEYKDLYLITVEAEQSGKIIGKASRIVRQDQ